MTKLGRVFIVALFVGAYGAGAVAYPVGQAAPQTGKAPAQEGSATTTPPPAQPSKEELQDMQTIQNQLDNDRAIQQAADFEKKYPNSPLLSWVYFFAGRAYLQKQQTDKAIEFCQKSAKVNADNLGSLMIAASLMPQPPYLEPKNDLDKAKALSEAEGYATHALQLIAQIPKQAAETDDQFKARKDDYLHKMHASLAMIHLERARMGLGGWDTQELAKSEQEYKLAIEGDPNPSPEYLFRVGEVYMHENKVDEAIEAFTKAETLEPQYKPFADPNIEKLKKMKPAQKPAGSP